MFVTVKIIELKFSKMNCETVRALIIIITGLM